MLTLIIVLVLAAAVTFVLMRKGKIADANNNNIPDAIEKPIEVVKEKVAEVKAEVKEVAEKVKQAAPKKKPVAKQSAPKQPAKKNK
jgi:hypothetical protein